MASRRVSRTETLTVDNGPLHPPEGVIRRASVTNPNFAELSVDSKDAAAHESHMPFKKAWRLYRPAIGWSVLLSTAIVMEGYDTILLYNLFANDGFNHTFGNQTDSSGQRVVSAPWRSALLNGAVIGEIFGLAATGSLIDHLGYRQTFGGAMVLLTGFIFINFFARDLQTLLAGELLCGLSWGVFQTITTAYASEITPIGLRQYLTTYVNLCWVIGQLLGTIVLRAVVHRTDEWAYKIPFALQWIWPVPILIGCFFAPESPWWLVRHERYAEAQASVVRLTTRNDPEFSPRKTVAMMRHTTQIEEEMGNGTSYLDCFKGVDLRRTEIVCVVWLSQILSGSNLLGYSGVFLEAAGLAPERAFDLTVGVFVIGAAGTILSWFMMSAFGRRTLFVGGMALLLIDLVVVGLLGTAQSQAGGKWAIGVLLLIFAFLYDSTVGPVCYALVAELSSTRLKAKTIVLARVAFNIGTIVVNVLTNYQLTSTAWNWGAYSAFFWAGTNFCCLVWLFFGLPEPKGRSYAELDLLFEHRVSARNFKRTPVDVFRRDVAAASEETGSTVMRSSADVTPH